MRKAVVLLLFIYWQNPEGFCQYTYFNEFYDETLEESIAISSAYSRNGNYVNFGLVDLDNMYQLLFRILNSEGEIVEDVLIPLPDTAYYIGSNSAFQEYSEGLGWAGGLVTANESNTGTAIWFDPDTYQPQWIHFFNDLVDEQTTSPMSCLRKMDNGHFYVGGNLFHFLDGKNDIGVDEFTTYIAHLDELGIVIDQWFFDEGNQFFKVEGIFELDNGKLLMSGMRSINQYADHFLMLFNPATGEIEDEHLYGGEWVEVKNNLRKMPDGNFYVMYDSVLWADTGLPGADILTSCWLGKINTVDLGFEWQMEIPLEDTEEISKGIGIIGFEPTLDSGYVFCYNHAVVGNYSTPHLVKLNSDFEIEWVKDYDLPIGVEYQMKGIVDLTVVQDGGFLCTGKALVPDQRQWTFKTDACGEIEVSDCPAVSVNEKVVDRNASMVYPNPAGDNVSLLLNGASMYAASIEISDMTGRVIITIDRAGNAQVDSLDVTSLSIGSYMVQLKDSDGQLLESLILIKE